MSTKKPLRLLAILASREISVASLARQLEIPRSTLTTWLHGHSTPLPEARQQLEIALVELNIEPRLALAREGEPPPKLPRTRVLVPRRRMLTRSQLRAQKFADTNPEEEEDVTDTRQYLSIKELERFKLTDDPFDDMDALSEGFLTPEATSVLKMLSRAVLNRQILALTAEPGAGKSTLLRLLAARTAPEANIKLVMPATLDRNAMTANTFAVAILRELTGRDTSGLSSEGRAELLTTTLASARRDGLFPALVIDEAHCLNTTTLLAIKQLWDRNDLYRGLAVILAGQPPLATTLRKDATVRELAARTRLVELPNVSGHVADYLRWRFARVAGNADAVFAPEAYIAIAKNHTLPLAINNAAARSMRMAFAVGDAQVTAAHVGRVTPLRAEAA